MSNLIKILKSFTVISKGKPLSTASVRSFNNINLIPSQLTYFILCWYQRKHVCRKNESFDLGKLEPNMLKILSVIPSRTSPKITQYSYFILTHINTYYSHTVLYAFLFQVLTFREMCTELMHNLFCCSYCVNVSGAYTYIK